MRLGSRSGLERHVTETELSEAATAYAEGELPGEISQTRFFVKKNYET